MNTDINLDLFEDVPSPKDYRSICRLSMSARGQFSQNDAFRNVLAGQQCFRLRVSPDGRYLSLDPKEPHNIEFTSNGVRTHRELLEVLRSKGLIAPFSFKVSWLEERGLWLCQYDGLCSPAVKVGKRKVGAL